MKLGIARAVVIIKTRVNVLCIIWEDRLRKRMGPNRNLSSLVSCDKDGGDEIVADYRYMYRGLTLSMKKIAIWYIKSRFSGRGTAITMGSFFFIGTDGHKEREQRHKVTASGRGDEPVR